MDSIYLAGMKPQSRLTEVIDKSQRPDSKKSLKGFLGVAGFYRLFIPNFAHVSQPLAVLTSNDTPFLCTTGCEKAFSSLKSALTSDPVLEFPDFSRQFIVEVDASNYAIGGVCSQLGPADQEHPIAHLSTALQKSQQNWSATTKQSFALVMAVRHWHVDLAG